MSEFLSETEGCDLLARLFRARGYAIERNLLFREYGVEFHVDGWDAKQRVGFEFLSSEDDDHDDLTLSEYQTLATAQQRGELALFIIDEVADARRSRRTAGPARKPAAKKKKPAAVRGAVEKKRKKVVAKKVVAKKNAAVATKVRAGKKSTVKKSASKKVATKKFVSKKAASKKAVKKKAAGKR